MHALAQDSRDARAGNKRCGAIRTAWYSIKKAKRDTLVYTTWRAEKVSRMGKPVSRKKTTGTSSVQGCKLRLCKHIAKHLCKLLDANDDVRTYHEPCGGMLSVMCAMIDVAEVPVA